MAYKVINNAYSTLASALTASDTIVNLATGTGSRFTIGPDYTYATLEDASNNTEVVKITAQSGDTLTVVRGRDGTTPRPWPVGTIIEVRPCAAAIEDIQSQTKAEAAAYTDASSATTLSQAQTYADGVGSSTLTQAQTYTQTYTQTYAAAAGAITSSGLTQSTNRLLGRTSSGSGAIEEIQVVGATLSSGVLLIPIYDVFHKADPTTVAFVKTGNGSAAIKAGTKVSVGDVIVEFTSQTAITMPSLTAGTDYAIWVKDDATIQASPDFVNPPSAGNWRKIGGFHYAPGSNASAQAGGDDTPQINEYSFWDLKFRPACPDPRGMTLVAGSFWADIYLLGVDHHINGTSAYQVTTAVGTRPPKIPTKFGGNGSATYSNLNWWVAAEVMRSWGKRLPTYDEFAALAYGTTEAISSGGSDVPTTGVNGTGATNPWYKFTSKWGVIQSTGCLYVWGAEFGGGAAGASWTANTGGRGSTYQMENVGCFGGNYDTSGASGSRCSGWHQSPTASSAATSARGICDHYRAE